MIDSSGGYFETRLKPDSKRKVLWESLWRYSLQRNLNDPDSLLELGAGRCELVNASTASVKFAVDTWPGVQLHADKNVNVHVGSVTNMGYMESDSVDAVVASNLVEHLTHVEFKKTLNEVSRILKSGGKLALIQPNFRYAYKQYFDDYTHVSIWTHVSLSDFLAAEGWRVDVVEGRFLPLTVKSRVPVHPWLIWAYLRSPIKPISGQMLVVATKLSS
jgi:SAM-dependent methyltransferase